LKADLHLHSKYSHRPSAWILRQIGGAESYTDPLAVYRFLKKSGKDLVTLTDHDTIAGCLEIAHLPDVFISEEITTYFPDDHCKIHVLAYNITEAQHETICRLRDNIFELVAYLNAEQIVHGVAHPMYAVNDRLRVAHFEKLVLLFKIFELNGARDAVLNQSIAQITEGLTKAQIEALADKHDLAPQVDRPWEKYRISGSDDHAGLYAGSSFTEVPDADSISGFLEGIRGGKAVASSSGATPRALAHNIYSIIYQFYQTHFHIHKKIEDPDIRAFLDQLLIPSFSRPPDPADSEPASSNPASSNPAPSDSNRPADPSDPLGALGMMTAANSNSAFLPQQILEKSARLLSAASVGTERQGSPMQGKAPETIWFHYAREVSDGIIREFADEILARLATADIFYLLNSLSTTASLYAILSPFFIAYSIFSRDWHFSARCRSAFQEQPAGLAPYKPNKPDKQKIALFTDTYNEVNGVTAVLKNQVKAAQITQKPLSVITCDPPQEPVSNAVCFDPIGRFGLPGYPGLKIFYPPILKMVDYCYQADFTHIHAETPGPLGLAALAVARTLNLPFHGTYHTSLPQTVRMITGDSQVEELVWRYILWFYGRMDCIYVPSGATAEELASKGIAREKIVVHQWGVDTRCFHPSNRDGFLARHYGLKENEFKLLYVGRVSREKNLDLLLQILGQVSVLRSDIRLIVVGDGPYLEEMKKHAADMPVVFTGCLTGEALARTYAAGDLFIMPSVNDTMGNVVLEAQASGTPVLVTDQGGPRENLIPEETGFVLPADSPDAFIERILWLAENPEHLAAMRQKARSFTEQRSFENCFLKFWERSESL